MTEKDRIIEHIAQAVRQYFQVANEGQTRSADAVKIPLMVPSYGAEEVIEALDSMLSGNVTMGTKVERFEKAFAGYIGVKHAFMVNSGSSANLLALSALTNPTFKDRIQPGDEVITPSVTWSTTVFPIINCGAVPVLVDVDLDTFDINTKEIEKAIGPRTRAIMLVHLLGNPCNMDEIMAIARKHSLYVIEDSCEAHGAEYKGQKVGSFGDMATFSFYFSHHISTIEGGMVLTSNSELAELLRMLRVFGWIRHTKTRSETVGKFDEINARYLFLNIGYNVRPSEIQGAFGIHQLPKLDDFIEIRRDNARFWSERLKKHGDSLLLHEERPGTRHVWFGYPVTVKPDAPFSRRELVTFLEGRGVETRPIMAGNFDEQPVMTLFPYRKIGDLPNSRLVMHNSFFFGNHHGIGKPEREKVAGYFDEFLEQYSAASERNKSWGKISSPRRVP